MASRIDLIEQDPPEYSVFVVDKQRPGRHTSIRAAGRGHKEVAIQFAEAFRRHKRDLAKPSASQIYRDLREDFRHTITK